MHSGRRQGRRLPLPDGEGWGFAAPEKAGGSADGLWLGFEQSGVPTLCWCVKGGVRSRDTNNGWRNCFKGIVFEKKILFFDLIVCKIGLTSFRTSGNRFGFGFFL